MSITRPAFPMPSEPFVPELPPLNLEDVRLRLAEEADYAFLRALYRQVRAAELAPVPWSEAEKHAFCDSQFALQDQHYRKHYAHSAFFVIERAGLPIGRLYLNLAPGPIGSDGHLARRRCSRPGTGHGPHAMAGRLGRSRRARHAAVRGSQQSSPAPVYAFGLCRAGPWKASTCACAGPRRSAAVEHGFQQTALRVAGAQEDGVASQSRMRDFPGVLQATRQGGTTRTVR